ncbi:1-deoxy-D-xylulose-5-phosphate reductoisomerase [Derxia gummosa]|uniref:1-deoxy-D-xylulose 5-phosphate reductoisomerase n=1 Tax=Derxia gummosa DSM 723 TaxID=1121388 RepID=A0A8B6X3H9_9BURK|nr:1-deoxy-D-xylulose-5-phosphate reductoisomerase [Derxia gummosa]
MSVQSLTLLGATGSIGRSTLDVIARHPAHYRVHALTAHRRVDELAALCLQFRPDRAVVGDAESAARLAALLREGHPRCAIDHGEAALCEVASAPEADVVMAAIVGGAGLAPGLAAARAGKRILLANKEALVMAGQLMLDAVAESGGLLLPVDSEHNAIFQCLPIDARGRADISRVRRLLLTASGGPFRTATSERMRAATPEQAVAHPNWSMGRKISVDSATMMNKGLEVIEARWLFGVERERIGVIVHPQSVVHSMVEYIDGSVLAQMGQPDMRTPIASALAWPTRIEAGVKPLDLCAIGSLSFEAPDFVRFPCLQLAFDALAEGGSASIVLNAANEIAVDRFLAGRLGFLAIADAIRATLDALAGSIAASIEAIFELDARARRLTADFIDRGAASAG